MTPTSRERAALLAARRGLSLFVRGKEIHGAQAHGDSVFVCRIHGLNGAWETAEDALLLRFPLAALPEYVLRGPKGEVHGSSLVSVVLDYLRGRYGRSHGR